MAWIEAHQQLERHPKTYDLMARMQWDLDTAIGKLFRFWWWCVDFAEDGNLTRHNDERLAGAVGLNGDKGKLFVQAMVESCWIDREPFFRVHDWWRYFGAYLRSKYKKNPEKWHPIRDSYIISGNGYCNGGSNRTPNLTKPNLTEPNTPHKPPKGGRDIFSEAFAAFWKSYPRCNRKVGKPQCWRKWNAKNLDTQAESIMRGLERWKPVWMQNDNKYVPLVHRWLNEEWWKTVPKKSDDGDSSWLDNPPGWQPRELEPEDIALITGKPIEEVSA